MGIGDRLKQARLALGYSADQVAARLGVSPATIYRYENGDIAKLPSKHIKPLAEYLCVSPAYLMDWSDDEPHHMDLQLFSESTPDVSGFRDPRVNELLTTFNSLSTEGKDYVMQQVHIARKMFKKG